jgi:hypothetical protein
MGHLRIFHVNFEITITIVFLKSIISEYEIFLFVKDPLKVEDSFTICSLEYEI